MGHIDDDLKARLNKEGLEPVLASEVTPTASISFNGIDANEEQLLRILEDAIKFIRTAGVDRIGAKPFQDVTMAFEHIDLGDIISVAHRS